MANKQCQRSSDEKVISDATTEADYYTGTKAALISEGVCKPGWFPAKLEKMTNFKKPRTKRTYLVENHKPETTLTHRLDAEGKDYWIVRVSLSEKEHQRRKAEQERRWAEYERRAEENRKKREAEREAREEQQKTEAAGPFAVYADGDRALLFRPGADNHLDPVTVVRAYGEQVVDCHDGETRKLWGYVVRELESPRRYYCAPHELRDYAHKPSHLKLAIDNRPRKAALK